MTPEESQVIRDVFARIRAAGPIQNDPQARAAINQELISNPDAGIGLIQLLVGLDQQRAQLAQERDQLLQQVRNSGQSTGGGLFGRAAPPPPPPPQAGPWGAQQYSAPPPPHQPSSWAAPQQPAAPQSSFLRTALGSAAGMAGGLFAFEAIRDVFGGHGNGGLFGGGYNSGWGGGPTEYITENTYINDGGSGGGGYDNSFDSGGGGGSFDGGGGSFDTSSDDGSSFSGGDDSSFG